MKKLNLHRALNIQRVATVRLLYENFTINHLTKCFEHPEKKVDKFQELSPQLDL